MAGSLIDGSGAQVRRDLFLAVKNGIITGIGPATDLPRDHRAIIDDFSFCTVVPALVDCSVSLSQSPAVDDKERLLLAEAGPTEKRALVARHIGYCHAHGVQGLAAIDENIDLKGDWLEEMGLAGLIDIRTSGRGGPKASDFLRVAYSSDIDQGEPPSPQLNREALGRILQQRGNKRAVVVANGEQQVAEALAAGCDAIEQGFAMGEKNLRQMADADVLWIPGVLRAKNALAGASSGGSVCCRFSMRYLAPGRADPNAEAYWKKMLTEQLGQLRRAREMGVKTAFGTGAGGIGILHGESMVEEMKLFLKAGYTLEQAFQCASENGARFLGMEDLGALTVGQKATFLITRGTVQQLPRKLSYLEGIYVDGAPSSSYRKNPVKAV